MRSRCSSALLLAGLFCHAASAGEEKKARDDDAAPEAGEFQIKLTPDAAREAERLQTLDLYRRTLKGDSEARQNWEALKQPLRVSLLAELVLRNEKSDARVQAIRDLAHLNATGDAEGKGIAALARAAVVEEGSIRDLARKALSARNDSRILRPLADVAMRHQDAQFRANAVAALDAIGGPPVFEVVIERWQEVSGPGPRSHMVIGQTRSYVSNYNISGDSYDPVVRNFITGVVLDTKVLSTERDIYMVTLTQIAGADVKAPDNLAGWKQWVDKERPRLVKEAAEKHRSALAALAGSAVDE